MERKDTHNYEDIIALPHPVSDHHARMTNYDRAAQFSPFAALVGLDGEMAETARLTEAMIELTESRKEELDGILRQLRQKIREQPEITVTWFQRDLRKTGGAYLTSVGKLKKIDDCSQSILLTDGLCVPISGILNIQETE